jgi:hypothetical protein
MVKAEVSPLSELAQCSPRIQRKLRRKLHIAFRQVLEEEGIWNTVTDGVWYLSPSYCNNRRTGNVSLSNSNTVQCYDKYNFTLGTNAYLGSIPSVKFKKSESYWTLNMSYKKTYIIVRVKDTSTVFIRITIQNGLDVVAIISFRKICWMQSDNRFGMNVPYSSSNLHDPIIVASLFDINRKGFYNPSWNIPGVFICRRWNDKNRRPKYEIHFAMADQWGT